MATLELENVHKVFSPTVIPVQNVSVQVEDGEFLALLGPSGCGKSTLLRLIAGLETPTQGNIYLGRRCLNSLPPGDRNMAMVFQSYALYPHLSIFENIASPLTLRKIAKAEIQQRVTRVAESLSLSSLLKRKPAQLSGGQRQRVALARALVREPEVFLLDEPLSNLDALLREQVREELKQLFRSQNRPVVYVTHDQTEAMTLATKIAVIENGEIQQLGTPLEIYQCPANQFVAGFVGSPRMNFLTLPCQYQQAYLGNRPLPLPLTNYDQPWIILGVRPEDLSPAPLTSAGVIPCQIRARELLGKEVLATCQIEGTDLTWRVLLPRDYMEHGDRLNLEINPQGWHWFEPRGDRRRL